MKPDASPSPSPSPSTSTPRRILLGVSGGIAAYKAAELLRLLLQAGHDVRVVMTRAAMEFVRPLTFQALSGKPVHSDLLDPNAEAAMGHIELARWAERILITPASADVIARLAHGQADDLLAAVCLASEAPIAIAPAMNRAMWAHAATTANLRTLQSRGVHVWGPDEGVQACGEVGPGRMLEPMELAARMHAWLAPGALQGVRVVVTSGPTHEPLDPVRYLGNRSSGRMGHAVAAAAAEAGAAVTLITGPVALPDPLGMHEVVRVKTAQDMHAACMARAAETDLFIGVAAVADFRPADVMNHKIKKGDAQDVSLKLVRNPDILADIAALPDAPFTVGFAAETENLAEYAQAKLREKDVQMIAANHVSVNEGFETEDNALTLFTAQGQEELPRAAKTELARQLIRRIAMYYNKQQEPS
ncbi:MAG: bifunctional phosphopantothenoylcysteine decarboxylase/phosphopantothenate--cysteine ligase CoaBC, partial [Gammaproteobacteria bacterium]